MTNEKCIFCQIIEGKVPTLKIYEDKAVLAILDINPASEGHVLVMPRTHFESLEQIPDNILILLFKLSKLLSGIIKKITKADGMNLYASEGRSAGQRVPHFYINLIPSYAKEPIYAEWSRKQLEPAKLKELGRKMREEAKKQASQLISEEAEKIKAKIEEERARKEEERKKEEKIKEEEEAEKIKKMMGRRIP